MDWITGMQKAIDYIEANLTEEIDYEKVAAQSFSSSYHFQRVFSILCGYTLGEYIRLRRLSLAGAELANGKEKVIDPFSESDVVDVDNGNYDDIHKDLGTVSFDDANITFPFVAETILVPTTAAISVPV